MNDLTPPTPDESALPKPYQAPALTELGSIDVVTAGPDNGDLDMIVGSSGGFMRDGTS